MKKDSLLNTEWNKTKNNLLLPLGVMAEWQTSLQHLRCANISPTVYTCVDYVSDERVL